MNTIQSTEGIIRVILQIVVALGLLNVWLLRRNQSTPYRGGAARNMQEEFAAYGLPGWFMNLIGLLKVAFAICLIAGIWLPVLVDPVAIGLVVLMVGAIVMHLKVQDPLIRSLPALVVLILSLAIVFI